MHEVGHTLGLRHNFRGSAGATAAQLADRSWTAVARPRRVGDGLQPAGARARPARQGDYYAPTIGSYDRWAITYGYADVVRPARPAAAGQGRRRGAPRSGPPTSSSTGSGPSPSQAADPAHLYGTDEDAGFGGLGLDPTVSRYDQTDDPLGWARERVALIDGLFDSLETRVVAPGQGYGRLRSAFTDLLNDRWYALLVTTKYLGGATTARDHRGDPDARPAFVTVPAARQRAALALPRGGRASASAPIGSAPTCSASSAPDRWMHWGVSPAADGRLDFPLHDWAMTQQGSLLGQLLDPAVLARIRDAELRATPDEPTVGHARAVRTADHGDLGRGGRRRARPACRRPREHHVGAPRPPAAVPERADPDGRESRARAPRRTPAASPA